MRPPCLIYLSTSTGVRTGCHYLISLSVCVRVYVTFVVFTDCESCTRPISTNPGSVKAHEYGLTRGTCFVARRLELVAVAGLLWISWCVLGGTGSFSLFFFPFERTRPAASMRPPLASFTSLLVLITRAVRGRFPQTPDLWTRESMGSRVGRVSSHAISSCTRWPGYCGFRGVFRVGRIASCVFFLDFFFSIFFLRTHMHV